MGRAIVIFGWLFVWAITAQQSGTGSASRINEAAAARELEAVLQKIDRSEASALAEMRARMNAMSPHQQKVLLGHLLLDDRNLSVNRNTPCVMCHSAETGFTGPSSIINSTTVSYPGSVRNRRGGRKPQSYNYAPYAPLLHYNPQQHDFFGGNFWDMRATGERVGNPAADQAQGPPLDPNEMGFRDYACVVYRMSQQPYRPLFEKVWGEGALEFAWPRDAETVCNTVWDGAGKTCDRDPRGTACLQLPPAQRVAVQRAFDQFAESAAINEASTEASPFSSKFDASLGGNAKLSPEEQAGLKLFNGKAQCNNCHSSDGAEPLFTDFTSANLGIPANPQIPSHFIPDYGVGAFLANPALNPNFREWGKYAPDFMGKFRIPTLRNVDMRPSPDFVKAYMHNGYLKSLKEVVHFYNTRDTLPRCKQGDPGEKATCWPAPDVSQNLDRTELGHLGLTDREEDEVVAFLKTLTDGYKP